MSCVMDYTVTSRTMFHSYTEGIIWKKIQDCCLQILRIGLQRFSAVLAEICNCSCMDNSAILKSILQTLKTQKLLIPPWTQNVIIVQWSGWTLAWINVGSDEYWVGWTVLLHTLIVWNRIILFSLRQCAVWFWLF